MTQITVNGNSYSDDGSTDKDMDAGGFREHMLPMVSDTMIDTAAKVAAAANQAELAQASAQAAAAAAATVVTGPGSNATSTTSLTVAMGVQTLVVQPGKTLPPGAAIMIASSASPRNWMHGTVDSYNSATGALQAFITNIGLVTPGVYPTLAAWTVSLSGPASPTGVVNEQKAGAIASAANIDLSAVPGNYLHITGSTGPVVSVAVPQGADREFTLDGTPVFTHSANLILPTGANITGEVGDVVTVRGEGGGVTKVTSWVRASGLALAVVPVVKPGRVLLATITPSGGPFVDLTTVMGADYDNYEIEYNGIAPVSADYLCYRFANAGVVDNSANYIGSTLQQSTSTTSTYGQINNFGAASSGGGGGELRVKNANGAAGSVKSSISESVAAGGGGGFYGFSWWVAYFGGPISGIRLFWSSGSNFAPIGRIQVFGIRKS